MVAPQNKTILKSITEEPLKDAHNSIVSSQLNNSLLNGGLKRMAAYKKCRENV